MAASTAKMRLPMFLWAFLVFSLPCTYALLGMDQPRIQTVNGHLKIVSGLHGDIVLQTAGKGSVIVNGQNVMRMLQLAVNGSSSRSPGAPDGSPLLSQLDDAINGPNGLMRRIAVLERGNATTAGTTAVNNLRRRTNGLTGSVTRLEASLTRVRNSLTANECASNPCRNGGTCEDKYNGFVCRCPSNWQGTLCDVDVNECANFAGTDLGCQNGATCINKPGTYECHCAQGYFGVHCTQRSNDCATASASELCGHGHCQSRVGGGYDCICHQGWTKGNGISCTQDVDECASSSPACSRDPPVPCINVPGSFHCGSCPAGYTGNGFYCLDINECEENNGGCSLQPYVQCINTRGSRRCGECPAGYQGDGITCTRVGICSINNGGCHILAQCVANSAVGQSYVQCMCPSGYVGDGVGPNGCTPVHSGGGPNPCANNPCGSNGHCISAPGNSYTCSCLPGYTGVRCTQTIDVCNPNPCQNGGTCMRQGLTGFTCMCPSSFTGARCQDRQQRCGGFLPTEAGTLSFPGRSSRSTSYPHGMSCAWVIITNNTKVLNVTFTNFHLEGSSGCTYDWLQVHDGRSAGDQLIGRFCGTTPPGGGHLISTHNALYLWFRSDGSVNRDGFSLTWNSVQPECGGSITAQSHGSLQSPGSPGNYPQNRDCAWIIRAPWSKRIQFHFFSLRMENHTTCAFDFLRFYDGLSEHDPIFAEYCNSSEPEPLLSPGSTVMIRFHSDNESSDTGFQIAYSTVSGVSGCGGLFTDAEKTINSPNYPLEYPRNIDCEWTIRLPPGERLSIEFTDFELEDSGTCAFDFVELRDGNSEESPLIGRYCGPYRPASFISNGNKVYLRFRTDMSVNKKGFIMKYHAVCGGIITAPFGQIHSPLYPNVYPNNKHCIWEIEQPLGKAIELNFVDFDLESLLFRWRSASVCPYDALEIRDGYNKESPLIGRYCGSAMPPTIISTYNHLWMEFTTDQTSQKRGFLANYTSIDTECGGILKGRNGTLQFPRYPNSYMPGHTCRWILAAPPGKSIQLTWDAFALLCVHECWADHVEVYDNSSFGASKMGRFCGERLPPVLVSIGNIMTVTFKSDHYSNPQGFSAHYNQIDISTTCGHTFHSTMGAIQSPRYPRNYLAGQDCTWVISIPVGQQIMLNITDFELESGSCKYDYLEIRNGGTADSPLVGKYCGTSIPRTIPSHSNQMFIHFVTDYSIQKKGFRITWDGTATGCGGIMTSPSGSFISPNYPQHYPDYSYCNWKISTSRGSIVQLVFIDIDIEEFGYCYVFDFLEIRDGKDPSGRLLGHYCNSSHPAFIRSSSNHMFVTFKSDGTGSGRGFHAKYDTVCNLDIRGFHGVIESPNFPEMYPNSLDCTWNIKAPQGHNVSIAFSHFELQGSESRWLWRRRWQTTPATPTCGFDFLEIKESFNDETTQNTLLKACGSQLPAPIESRMNTVQVHFHTDDFSALSGFRLEWTVKGCGGHLERPFGEFTSPSYPKHYPDSVLCEWLITVEWGSSVQLTIEDFSMERTQDCNADSLTIYGGIDDTAIRLTQLCHTQEKAVNYTSSGNNMFIRFVSDWVYSGRGFKASYKTLASRCGGHLTTSSGAIHSRNYPNNYYHREDCMWLIEVDTNHRINFTISDIGLKEPLRYCYDDYLAIYDGSSSDNEMQMLAKLCGSSVPQPAWYLSTSNVMVIIYKTEGGWSSKGFLANYSVMCGARIVTEDAGQISLGDLVNTSPHAGTNCTWTIVGALPDDRVTLTITHLDFPQTDGPECYPEYLEVYDGENVNATRIGQYCGSRIPPHITSHGNALFLNAYTLTGSHDGRFVAFYSVERSACGGDLTSESGSFTTPGYPGSYPLDIECVWSIRTSPGNSAVMTFSQFSIGGTNCDEDYVEVRRESAGGPIMGLYCSDSSLPSNLTAAHSIWVKFRSGTTGPPGTGFMASYQLLHGNNLEGQSGQLASPFYPLPYTKYGKFSWRITVEFNHLITLNFKNFFIPTYFGICLYSSLTVYDGYDETAPTQTEYCGGRTPESFTSTSNIVYIVLRTHSAREGAYFLLEWLQVEPVTPSTDYIAPSVNASGCGSTIQLGDTFNTSQVNISSPKFGSGYEPMDCVWIFETPPTSHVAVNIRTLDVRSYSNWCHGAKVQIYSGKLGTQDWTLMLETCLSNASSLGYIHGSSLVKIVFHASYRSREHAGFSATVLRDCGGSLELPSGVLEYSPQVPAIVGDSWANSVVCQWNVTVPAGRNVSVTFDRFNIPAGVHGTGCGRNEFLMLKNGGSEDSPLLGNGKYCGEKPTGQLQTTGNKLFVKFVGFKRSEGFKIQFQQVSQSCGGNFILTRDMRSVTISSPRYPQIPPPHTECIYVFTAPAGENMQIEYAEHFDLRGYQLSGCPEEGIEVRDGLTLAAKIEGVHCGAVAPNTYTSSSNVLHIRFYTNTNNPHTGFQATVSIGKCGGTVRGYKGVIKSPGYPGKYERNIKCVWHIRAPYDYYYILNFQLTDLDLPGDDLCYNYDHVTVSQILPFNDNAVPLATYCGFLEAVDDNLLNLQTTYARALITFNAFGDRSDSDTHKGFHFTFTTTWNPCIQELTGPAGEVTSPGYPNARDQFQYCQYDITVPKGRRVSLDVLDMDLDNSLMYNRPSSFVSVNDGGDNGVTLARLTAQNVSAHIDSFSNRLTLHYYSRKTTGHRGFKLSYSSNEPQVCGGILKPLGNDVLSSPSSNGSSFFCEWQWDASPVLGNQIVTPSTPTARTFTLNLLSLNISGSYEGFCRWWYSGLNFVTGDLNLLFCKNYTSPKYISSPYPSVTIVARQDTSSGSRMLQFSGQYSVSDCGGVIVGPEANVTSPGYPSAPSKNIHCAWAVTYPEGQRIKVQFYQVNIRGGPGEEHYFAIHNGESISSPEIVRLTPGANSATDIISETNRIWIEYHTGSNPSGSGFSLHLSPVISGCGGILHDFNRELVSPNYPKQYPSNSECDWDIRIPDGYHVNLTFIERFQLENCTNCQKDYVEVFDYVASEWISLGRICGRAGLQQFNSTGNRMRVLFRSDGAINGDGFKALWNYACGGIISNRTEGTVMSPGYPNHYASHLTCNYTILAAGHVIQAHFLDFNIEKGRDDCSFDNVTMFGALRKWENVPASLGTYCGQEPPLSITSRDRLSIIFKTDAYISKTGFLLKYQVYSCGGIMSSPGIIKSPWSTQQPDDYSMLNCTWQIVAPASKLVLLRFTEFSMPSDNHCYYSSSRLEVYDGNTTDTGNRLGLFCSNLTDALPVISSINSSMTVSFITYSFQPPSNFTAEVIFMYGPPQGCGGIIHVTDTSQTIQSVDIDRNGQYEPFLDCHWTILANLSSIIHLEFDSLNIETCHNTLQASTECNCDYIEVRDGGSQYSELLGRFCGNQIPQKIITSSDHMWVRFVSDGTYNGPGFRARVFQTASPCGPPVLNVGTVPQELKSPGYPGNYPANIRCRWLLSGPPYESVDIHITDLQITGGGNNCEKARLSVNDKRNSEYIREGLGEMMIYSGKRKEGYVYGFMADPMASAKFCGTVQPMDFYSGTGDVEINFIASSQVARGFKLTYSSTGCNRNYSHVQGRIQLDRFTAACTIMISAPQNSTISLYVSDFYIGGDCSVDSMKVYDGGSSSAPLLSTMCGHTLPDPVFSSGPLLLLQLTRQTTYSITNIDFTYTTTDKGSGCGGKLFNTAGTFTSTMYPTNFRNISDCQWQISVPKNLHPYLTFRQFSIGSRTTCSTDFLEIYDFSHATGAKTLRTKYCGEDQPAPYEGATATTIVRYVTSVHNGGSGWVIHFIAKHPESTIIAV